MDRTNIRYALVALATVLLGLFAGCTAGDTASPITITGGTSSTNVPATVQVSVLPSAIANAGTATVTATVIDSTAAAVSGATVNFLVSVPTAGTFSANSGTTSAAGTASVTFTAGAAVNAVVTITASVVSTSGTISNTASLTIGTPPQVPATIAVALGAATIANPVSSTSVTATVRDGTSAGIAGANVSFSSSTVGAGTFSPAATAVTSGPCPGATPPCGVASVTFDSAAANTLTSISASIGALSNSASLTIGTPSPPVPASMNLTVNPLSITIASSATVTLTVLDGSGNPAFNAPVTLTITSGTTLASFSPMPSAVLTTNLTTNGSGVVTATVYSGASSGAVTIQGTTGALAPASTSFMITSNPASITLSVANPNLTTGSTTTVTATVRNVLNNPVTDGTVVNFAITSICPCAGTLSASQGSTVNGVATVTFTANNSTPAITGGVIVQASVGTLTPVQTIIIVNAATAGSLLYDSVLPSSGVINIQGAGTSTAIVTFKLLDINGTPLANQNISFSLIGPTGAYLGSTVGSLTSTGTTNATGLATTTLTAGTYAGPARVLAQTTTGTILYASSGAISIGGGVPSYKWLSISVSKYNIDGMSCDNVQDTISVNLADRFGNYNILTGTSVSFATAYGAIDTSNITNASGQTSVTFRSQNPRSADGQVRILVQTTGEEDFTDVNGNGVFDSGTDTFVNLDPNYDLAEPYIDADHNGSRGAGEIYFNWPISVTGAVPGYNGGNSQWDSSLPIWKTIDIWMTGPPVFGPAVSHISCCDPATDNTCVPGDPAETMGNFSIPAGGYTVCYVYGADANNNALISGTKVTMTDSSGFTNIGAYSGYTTYIDHMVAGPEITGFTISNNAAFPPKTATPSATIDWPGKCNALKLTIPYTGTITLL